MKRMFLAVLFALTAVSVFALDEGAVTEGTQQFGGKKIFQADAMNARGVLTGNITLTAKDALWQSADCGGSNRNWTLPAKDPSIGGLTFYIANVGAANNIVVKDSGGNTIATIQPSQIGVVSLNTTATTWNNFVFAAGSSTAGFVAAGGTTIGATSQAQVFTNGVALDTLTGNTATTLAISALNGSSAAGNSITITAGAGNGSGNAGGNITETAGAAGTGNAAGGTYLQRGGVGAGTQPGGSSEIRGGASAGSSAGNGGAALVTGGALGASGTGTSGAITIRSGAGASGGTVGNVTIDCGAANSGTAGNIQIGTSNATVVELGPIADTNGNKELAFTATGSAVDYLTLANGAAGSPGVVTATATGSDTNIGVTIAGKGSGFMKLGQATATGIWFLGDQPIMDSSGNNQIAFSKTGSAVDYLQVTNGAAGTPGTVTLTSTGSDTNVGLTLATKGTGPVKLGTSTSTGVVLLGSQPIQDQNGNNEIAFTATGSAVDYMTFANGAAGTPGVVTQTATGSDTNIGVTIAGKGSGFMKLGQATATGIWFLGDQPIMDSSGNAQLSFVKTGTAVDGWTMTNGAAGNPATVSLAGTGSDTNIGVTIAGKGTGPMKLGQATATGIWLVGDQPIMDSSGNNQLAFTKTGSAVDAFTITNAATGNPGTPKIAATGGDANIQMNLAGKGTGMVCVNQGGSTSFSPLVVTANAQSSAAGAGNGADTTEDTLFTFSLPANTLKNNNSWVRITAGGHLASNADNKLIKIYFGSELISSGTVTSNNKNWSGELKVIKTGSNTQQTVGTMIVDTTVITPAQTSGAETDSSAITIKITGQDSSASTANSVTAMYMIVEVGNQ